MKDKSIGIKSLGLRHIGVRSVGCIGVPSRKKGAPVPPTPTPARILAKMQAEQPQLYESLRLWYDPRLQGLTNEYIQEQAIESGTFYLENLQGDSRYDMRVYGMSGLEGDGYVNEDGQLVFDGIDDRGRFIDTNIQRDYTLFWRGNMYNGGVKQKVPFALSSSYTSSAQLFSTDGAAIRIRTSANIECTIGSKYVVSFGHLADYITDAVFTPSFATINNETRSGQAQTLDTKYLRLMYTGSHSSTPSTYEGVFTNLTLFSRTLTDTEIQWVRDNMINI